MSTTGALALLADIGGTNARFALADTGSPTPLRLDTVHGFAVFLLDGPLRSVTTDQRDALSERLLAMVERGL